MANLTITVPANVTLTNISNHAVKFVPKGLNSASIEKNSSVTFTVNRAEDVMYYLAQAVSGELTVTYAAVNA